MAELRTYRRKRDFTKTDEPEGASGKRPEAAGKERLSGGLYCIQKHAARRLHHDLRLELDGVLLSWAVPKGPSLDPKVRRLAVHVEDHPLEYGDFEGTIPKGEYGGGTVMLWDTGTWEPVGDAHRGLEKGELKFRLAGERLQGGWVLVHTRGLRGRRGEPVAAHQGARRGGPAGRAGPVGPGRPQRLDGPHDGGDRRRQGAAEARGTREGAPRRPVTERAPAQVARARRPPSR